MTARYVIDTAILIPDNAEEISPATLLGVCASLKPAPGRSGNSAARSFLCHALDAVSRIYPDTCLLDLREHPLPFFDGRIPHLYDDASLEFVRDCVGRAGALLLSVPAYWSGVSGVFKNFIDVSCGPVYDMGEGFTTVFTNKPVGILVVGADEESARAGSEQACQIMSSTGARLIAAPVVIANPRAGGSTIDKSLQEIIATGAELARHILRAKERGGQRAAMM